MSAASVIYSRARDGAVPSLCEVDLELRAGELCVVLGPNGAGKSTLVRAIAGVVPLAKGSISIFGRDAAAMTRNELAQQIAVVPQHSEVALGFSVRDVVAMGRAPHQGALLRESRADRASTERNLELCDLAELSDRPVAELSGGEQKRVHIARALAQEAPILLLDEAGAHLDLRHTSHVYRLVREQVDERELACLAVMHDLNSAARCADRVLLMREGRLVADGSVGDVMTAEQLSDVFDIELDVIEHRNGRLFAPR